MSLHVHNTDVSKIVHLMLTTLVLGASSLTLETDDVIVQENDSIMLNCTYRNDSRESISNSDIRWQKQIGDTFVDVAAYSPPGGFKPFIVEDMRPFYDNRTKLIAPNTTLAAVLIIKDPSCSDVGTYRCWIRYTYPGSLGKTKTSLSTFSFNVKARLPEKFMAFPDELEENQSVSLVCSADVGSPWGNIKIWKISQYSDKPELIYTSNSTNNKTNNCTEFLNVTTTVTRYDNGAIFRCSSQNNLTRGLGPSKDSQSISVLYGPYMTSITLSPSKSVFTVGESLTIQCITDSNPLPTFKWYFRPNGTSVERPIGLTDNKLEFDSLQVTDSGAYICTAVNEVGSNSPNATTRVSVSVKRYYGCSQCGYIDTCQQNYDEIECIPNKWVPTAVVFMTLSVAFAVSSIVLYINRKRSQETIAVKTRHNTRSHPSDAPEDNGGGYASPSDLNRTQEAVSSPMENICEAYSQSKDFIKLQEHSLLLTHHNEPDGYTTTQEVVQYAAVQKKPTKDQVSDENVYDSAWNSDNVFFKLRPDTQGPHRSPEQQ